MKLWAGRFSKEADERVNDFNSSIAMNDRPVRPGIAAADRYLGSIRIRYQKMAAAWYHLNVAAVHYFIFFQ